MKTVKWSGITCWAIYTGMDLRYLNDLSAGRQCDIRSPFSQSQASPHHYRTYSWLYKVSCLVHWLHSNSSINHHPATANWRGKSKYCFPFCSLHSVRILGYGHLPGAFVLQFDWYRKTILVYSFWCCFLCRLLPNVYILHLSNLAGALIQSDLQIDKHSLEYFWISHKVIHTNLFNLEYR
jgi:hypothetical protein